MIVSRNLLSIVGWLLVTLGSSNVVLAKRFCGRELASVMDILCVEFVSMHDIKKNSVVPFAQSDYLDEEDYGYNSNVEPGVRQASIANWFPRLGGPKYRNAPNKRYWSEHDRAATTRFRRAVAKECCDQDCSITDLMSYCKVVAPGVVESGIL